MWFHTEPISLYITSMPPSVWLPPSCSRGCAVAGVRHLSRLKTNQVDDTWFDLSWIRGTGRFRKSIDVGMLERLVKLNTLTPNVFADEGRLVLKYSPISQNHRGGTYILFSCPCYGASSSGGWPRWKTELGNLLNCHQEFCKSVTCRRDLLLSNNSPREKLFLEIAPSPPCVRREEEHMPTGRVTAQLPCGHGGCDRPTRISCAFTVSLITTRSCIGAAGQSDFAHLAPHKKTTRVLENPCSRGWSMPGVVHACAHPRKVSADGGAR